MKKRQLLELEDLTTAQIRVISMTLLFNSLNDLVPVHVYSSFCFLSPTQVIGK